MRSRIIRLGALGVVAIATGVAATPAKLCGWWSNPTPNNAWLLDGTHDYIVSRQGEGGADGDWPRFGKSRYVATNGDDYGYGCACLKAAVVGTRITRIYSSIARPLRQCRMTPSLRKAEPSIK